MISAIGKYIDLSAFNASPGALDSRPCDAANRVESERRERVKRDWKTIVTRLVNRFEAVGRSEVGRQKKND